jgi:hypothetical protein
MNERDYETGRRAGLDSVLGHVLRELSPLKGPDLTVARLVYIHSQTLAALRAICDEFGDNDWSDDLHPADVIEKHLARHLRNMRDACPSGREEP